MSSASAPGSSTVVLLRRPISALNTTGRPAGGTGPHKRQFVLMRAASWMNWATRSPRFLDSTATGRYIYLPVAVIMHSADT